MGIHQKYQIKLSRKVLINALWRSILTGMLAGVVLIVIGNVGMRNPLSAKAVGIIAGSIVVVSLFNSILRQQIRRKNQPDATPVCTSCGYDMTGLKVPRCPECGVLKGFTRPMNELGISEDELKPGA